MTVAVVRYGLFDPVKSAKNHIIEQNHLNLTTSDIANLSLNIYFDGEKISLTTMASMNIFSMDKTLANIWDANVSAFFKQNQIF